MGKVKAVDIQTLLEDLEKDRILLIDVREEQEYFEESIPESLHLPASTFHPEAVPVTKHKKVVFHCTAGVRSERTARQWLEWTGDEEAYHFPGGMLEWKKQELPLHSEAGQSKKIWKSICNILGISILIFTLAGWALDPLFLIPTLLSAVLLLLGPSTLVWLFSNLKYSIMDN